MEVKATGVICPHPGLSWQNTCRQIEIMAAIDKMRNSNDSISQIAKILRDQNQPLTERFRALFTLRNLGGKKAINAIAGTFSDTSALLKHELAYCLGQMQDDYAVSILTEVLQDENQEVIVRHEAGEVLLLIVLKDHFWFNVFLLKTLCHYSRIFFSLFSCLLSRRMKNALMIVFSLLWKTKCVVYASYIIWLDFNFFLVSDLKIRRKYWNYFCLFFSIGNIFNLKVYLNKVNHFFFLFLLFFFFCLVNCLEI